MRNPGQETGHAKVSNLDGSDANAEPRNGTNCLPAVLANLFAPDGSDDVLGKKLGLANRVLSIGNAVATDTATGEVRNGLDITSGPRTLNGLTFV